jgi:CheY-like chemotaxis protein
MNSLIEQPKAAAEAKAKAAPLPQVLVVDDEECMSTVFQRALPPSRYAVTFITDGHQALELAATREFDLAFVDYFLAEMNGAEVAQKMRELQPKLKTVLMSCYAEINKSLKLELAGASAFLAKPLFSAEFTADIQKVVEQVLPAPKRQKAGF